MRSTPLSLALLGAFAGAVSAQSSVTLFGDVDLSTRFVDNNGIKQYQLVPSGLNPNRLGIRGVEDLGGGFGAGFWLEGAMSPDSGTPAGQTWERRSTVSLSGGFGEVRLGRDYTATYWNFLIFDPFGGGGVGRAGNLILVLPGVPTGGAYGTLVRANNMVGYLLPSGIGGGFYGQLQVAAGENSHGNKFIGGRLGYAAGAINAAAAYGQTQVSGSLDGDLFNIGASWDFGAMSLSAYYGRLKIGGLEQNNWFAGVRAPIGLWTLKASYGDVDRSGIEGAIDANGQSARQFAVGAVYNLSKRTALYGTWATIANRGNARFIVGGLNNVRDGGAVAGADSQGFEFGLAHSF